MAKAQKTSFRSPFYPTGVANEAFAGNSGIKTYQNDSSNSQRNNDNRISICCPKNNARGSIILAVAGVAVVIRVALNLQVKWGYLKEHDSTLGLCLGLDRWVHFTNGAWHFGPLGAYRELVS